MKLTILGATGSVGQELVNQALTAGHTVTALVRNPDKLGDLRSRVTVVQGDVANAEAMKLAISGSDAVLNTLGHTKSSPDDVLAVATSNTITAMDKANVKRLVVLANTTLSDVDDQPTTGQRVQRKMMGMMMGTINSDHENQAKLIANSDLDWTIVRAATLGKGPVTGTYRVGKLDSNAGSSIARADVADFMLKCAANGKYVKALPVVSK
jgi:putative NADH-flavin reductase